MLSRVLHLERIYQTGVIAVIRAETVSKALRIADAVKKGGIDLLEITLTVPGAIKVIEELRSAHSGGKILLGAGTVLDVETARLAMMAGAEFIVGPSFNSEVMRLCNRYGKLYIPGCMTPTEIVSALESGASLIKLFPGNTFGPAMVKTLKGPLPQAEFIPTGGVSLDNVKDWIANGCYAVGVGGELTRGGNTGDYGAVTDTARAFINRIKEVRDI